MLKFGEQMKNQHANQAKVAPDCFQSTIAFGWWSEILVYPSSLAKNTQHSEHSVSVTDKLVFDQMLKYLIYKCFIYI